MSEISKITYDENGNAVSFVGPEAVKVWRAASLRSGLGLLAVGIKPHRTWTSLKLALNAATEYTGNKYSGRKDIERARADLHTYVQLKKAELA
jgi:hypothetical protein